MLGNWKSIPIYLALFAFVINKRNKLHKIRVVRKALCLKNIQNIFSDIL